MSTAKKAPAKTAAASPSAEIDARLKGMTDWRGTTLTRARKAILAADPAIIEDIKWRKPSNMSGVPTWEKDGLICTGETYTDKIKLTFAKGAALEDPAGLFNASLDAGTRRAIDFHEGDKVNEKALKALVKSAIALNGEKTRKS